MKLVNGALELNDWVIVENPLHRRLKGSQLQWIVLARGEIIAKTSFMVDALRLCALGVIENYYI